MATATSGRKQAAESSKGAEHAPNPSQFYDRSVQSLEPGRFVFQHILVRVGEPKDKRYMLLDPATTSSSWEDSGPLLTGSITLQRPQPDDVESLPIQQGDRVQLQLWWGGKWDTLWDMRVPEIPSVSLKEGTMTVELTDDLTPLHVNDEHWDFKVDKQHPNGWTADEITEFVCKKCGVEVGKLDKAKFHTKKLKMQSSGLEVIRRAWAKEREHTHERIIIKFRGGKLEAVKFARPTTAYVISGIELDATTNSDQQNQRPATAIKATGRIKVAKKKEKRLSVEIRSKAGIARFGYSQITRDFGRVSSKEELREKATRELAQKMQVRRTAELTIPGIPFIEKGSTVRWITEEPGWSGIVKSTGQVRSYGFVTSASHTLTPANYETNIAISQVDPYFKGAEKVNEERRKEKKREREGRKATS